VDHQAGRFDVGLLACQQQARFNRVAAGLDQTVRWYAATSIGASNSRASSKT
jgi:hypothetical protein